MVALWTFPDSPAGKKEGFNNSAINIFADERDALVREVLQNSLDAARNGETVQVAFTAFSIPKKFCPDAPNLCEHLRLCSEELDSEDKDVKGFYDRAIESLRREKIPFLCISDFGTTGLRGPVTWAEVKKGEEGKKQKKEWLALLKGDGISEKQHTDSGGSFGHGAAAPFATSGLRTVFYWTRLLCGEERFQGMSILQSHKNPKTNQLTCATGYYGSEGAECPPLIGNHISRDLRDNFVRSGRRNLGEVGTSIFIPCPRLDLTDSEQLKTVAAHIIANFYYSIRLGKLEIELRTNKNPPLLMRGGDIKERFAGIKRIDHIASDFQSEFEAIETINNYSLHGSENIESFGQFKWFLRVNDNNKKQVEGKSVAIARSAGMLITSKPLHLRQSDFGSDIGPFHMFVHVDGKSGSELLRSMEDPRHKKLSYKKVTFDRDTAKKTEKAYRCFVAKIKEIVKKHVAIGIGHKSPMEDPGRIFPNTGDKEGKDGFVSLDTIPLLGEVSSRIKKKPSISLPTPGSDELGVATSGSGAGAGAKGDGTKVRRRLTNRRNRKRLSSVPLKGLKRSPPTEPNRLLLHFDAPGFDRFAVQILKAGETDNQIVKLRARGETEYSESLEQKGVAGIVKLDIETEEAIGDYVIEGVAIPLNSDAE